MPVETIGDWERRRGLELTEQQIESLPEIPEPGTTVKLDEAPARLLVALQGRVTAGLGVQLLWDPRCGDTFITVALNGETETFQVDPEDAGQAFIHPYAFGATLPL